MAETWEVKEKLKPRGLDGISDQQIDYHFDFHYKGYVTKLNEIWSKLPDVDLSKANQNYSDLREMKLEETFNYDGSMLHEYYFESLTKDHTEIPASVKEQIEKDFGSYEKFVALFKATGTAFRGWAHLIFDLNYGKLRIVGADIHSAGAIWNAIMILPLDVYEHAYYTDYGAKRAPYLDAFMKNVNWKVVEKRLEKAKKLYEVFKE
ncbi:superoxide dismutase [Picrophilus oshimae]|uniref:Superoxide dismutase n=1 Tax=Picrophilus torridus (strain ATCC 700027 / DSM 9790 / JCM 10055 / NBRC 100828 / KAW 2/3) TaxID=1122961 RepID=Q6L1T7_PICTO|nr:superoxide dismutase [Picrophilus oshimae]AAT43065.1 superoxide dismutase [Fe] [Picrophilus oshimae DSM 9789]SMD30628.1 superoxide dismutase, Fe-Mn family [Picrophilus oshimae DSM 9789]